MLLTYSFFKLGRSCIKWMMKFWKMCDNWSYDYEVKGCVLLLFVVIRESVTLTNVGRLLEKRGKEFLGSLYKDPITSFADFQKFSVSNPEVHLR